MDQERPDRAEDSAPEAVLLLEGWMFGVLLYPFAMEIVAKVPPANDQSRSSG